MTGPHVPRSGPDRGAPARGPAAPRSGVLALALAVIVGAGLSACGSFAKAPYGEGQEKPGAIAFDEGREAIARYGCGSCHEIPGVRGADGKVASPLISFSKRGFIAGQRSNNRENLIRWLKNPQQVEPGTAMPNLGVTDQDAENMASYLLSLR